MVSNDESLAGLSNDNSGSLQLGEDNGIISTQELEFSSTDGDTGSSEVWPSFSESLDLKIVSQKSSNPKSIVFTSEVVIEKSVEEKGRLITNKVTDKLE